MGTNEIKLVLLRRQTYQQFLKWKRIDYHLKTTECAVAYRHANQEDRRVLQKLVDATDVSAVKRWIEKFSQADMQYWSYRKLRLRARLLNISRWSRLDRQELIYAITEQEKKQNARRDEANRDVASGHRTSLEEDDSVRTGLQNADRGHNPNQSGFANQGM